MKKLTGVSLQVLHWRVQAVANELAENVLQAAHSNFLKETWDLGALITDPHGEAFACSREVSAKRIGMNLAAALSHLKDIRPGDIFISNDPIATKGLATHLPDLFLWKPVFSGETIVAYGLVFIHVNDVGGIVPGSISPISTEMFQEGIRIPPTRLFAEGELQPAIKSLILANTRIPEQLWGDITAVVGALNIGEKRIVDILRGHTADEFLEGAASLLELSEQCARATLSAIPDGSYSFIDYIDGIPDRDPIRLKLTLIVSGDEVTMDFTGSDEQVKAAYNLFTHSGDGHWGVCRAFADFFESRDRSIPWNSGMLRAVKVKAPFGSVVNPSRMVACGSRAATFFRIYYMVFGALAQAVDDMPASGPAECGIMLIATRDASNDATRINVGQALFGGCGARPAGDGFEGNEMVTSYLRNVPVEILEQEMPVQFESYGCAIDSGGAGLNRGGNGVRVRVRFHSPESVVVIRGLQRHQFRAWGIHGGHAGATGTITVNPDAPGEQKLPWLNVLNLTAGDVLEMTTAGGGGLGDPLARPVEQVEADLADSLVSAAAARSQYGVVAGADGRADAVATRKLREQMRHDVRAARHIYAFGAERDAYESRALAS